MKETHLADRPRTMKELGVLYRVSPQVVRKWLRVAGLDRLASKRGTGTYFYTPAELAEIASRIGEPYPEMDKDI